MPARYAFHREALAEYKGAVSYYRKEASQRVADRFVAVVESALDNLCDAPTRWRTVEESGIRRCKINRFPFSIFYRWDSMHEGVMVYALMHDSREPGYWQHRVEPSA